MVRHIFASDEEPVAVTNGWPTADWEALGARASSGGGVDVLASACDDGAKTPGELRATPHLSAASLRSSILQPIRCRIHRPLILCPQDFLSRLLVSTQPTLATSGPRLSLRRLPTIPRRLSGRSWASRADRPVSAVPARPPFPHLHLHLHFCLCSWLRCLYYMPLCRFWSMQCDYVPRHGAFDLDSYAKSIRHSFACPKPHRNPSRPSAQQSRRVLPAFSP
ncbi:uncharacterized protein J3D65DRAFT_407970 [Phyllosticta citribraziliensis]|uniref:Uncharacterized protein n=1 Tax=Phyllosticta citribraziliensis TaxID=989973 RepID=A0ABR1LLX8_9PEZI